MFLAMTAVYWVGYKWPLFQKHKSTSVGFGPVEGSLLGLILDRDRPSKGLITLETANKNIVELRSLFDGDK